jgi:hypothetical protein
MSTTSTTLIPLSSAYTVRQMNTGRDVHRVRASETIGKITMIPGQAVGQVDVFRLNPEDLTNTRLNAISRNYQKFKFKKAQLRIMSNLATAITGQLVTGYTNSAEMDITPGPQAAAQIFDLPGAAYQAVYTPTVVNAALDGKAPPFYIKDTGKDINTTIQGQFFIGISQQVTTAAPVEFPVILDYEVELSGNALQIPTGQTALAFPSVNFMGRSEGNYTLAIAAGETLSLPSFTPGTLMQMKPSYELSLNVGAQEQGVVKANYLSWFGADQWRFYESVDAFNTNSQIMNIGIASDLGSPNQGTPRTTIEPYQGNQ